jgi:hypothetical protein
MPFNAVASRSENDSLFGYEGISDKPSPPTSTANLIIHRVENAESTRRNDLASIMLQIMHLDTHRLLMLSAYLCEKSPDCP